MAFHQNIACSFLKQPPCAGIELTNEGTAVQGSFLFACMRAACLDFQHQVEVSISTCYHQMDLEMIKVFFLPDMQQIYYHLIVLIEERKINLC